MRSRPDKTQDNKTQSVANVESFMQNDGGSTFQFVDNRSQMLEQKNTQKTININGGNAKAKQLKVIKDNRSSSFETAQLMIRAGRGEITEITDDNEKILLDALNALLEVQVGTAMDANSFARRTSDLSDLIAADGVDVHKNSIEELYMDMREISFLANPILHEAWNRCLLSTRDVAMRSKYGKVGGKFRRKFEEVLAEISGAYVHCVAVIDKLITVDLNKEHMINKVKTIGGAETAHENLMDAGIGERQMNGRGSLAELHKELHKLKSGGFVYDYTSVLDEIKDIITQVQSVTTADDMGVLTHEQI